MLGGTANYLGVSGIFIRSGCLIFVFDLAVFSYSEATNPPYNFESVILYAIPHDGICASLESSNESWFIHSHKGIPLLELKRIILTGVDFVIMPQGLIFSWF